MLPWLGVPANKVGRASANRRWGGPLKKVYPPGVFFSSSTYGAPGQTTPNRVMPTGQNQALDPRSLNASYVNLGTSPNSASLFGGSTTNNIGGNSYGTTTLSQPDSSTYLFFGIIAILAYLIFK
jgi:hypothetical protein